MLKKKWWPSLLLSALISQQAFSQVQVLGNQVAYNAHTPKSILVSSDAEIPAGTEFIVRSAYTKTTEFTGKLEDGQQVTEWANGKWYNRADFSKLTAKGTYYLVLKVNGKEYESKPFYIGENALTELAVPAIREFFFHQRASSPEELGADKQLLLFGSNKRVDLTGGWCDASGDVSKYFSHLAYTNFMSPQQIPMVDWSMINTVERIPAILDKTNTRASLTEEALYGADYIMRSLSPEGYFYMTVFSYFKKDPSERRVVGLLADSKTTADYQCAYREGGGMGIAALARISTWHKNRDFTSAQYLAAAERAFEHLEKNNLKYCDNGKENIIDDYCALMGATELWLATGKPKYQAAARLRANNLGNRMTHGGYFLADDNKRPFWHAADAGLPIISLARYLDAEKDQTLRAKALNTIRAAVDYNLSVTQAVKNPFGYARQSFLFKDQVQNGFFIPHENESGWWWQGENARLGSLASAMLVGGRLVYPAKNELGVKPEIATYASNLVNWVLGCNPYDMCMMYSYGKVNVPYMASMYGHGSGNGGISNGITGKNADGTGIDWKVEDNGNEWRWSEQWIPHSGWFLQAVTALASN
ncbi:cellulase-like Ig domain-containing protein [Chitinophaga skermanii]|uniref:Cellulase-like Ig domain-containing protein n=1 Tax=Chitinophaga skermanii TaxID=331697 RepID=A0A327Q005_9BACT|nr:glycoside hydrolase family 9 protein [Chitinophaga skermanii]RAI97718.1 cellulase-like Ig domain-containing protein [Chitinophaga skermanii]